MEMRGYLDAPAALPPAKNTSTHWIERWVGPLAGLRGSGEEQNMLPVAKLERTMQPVASRYIDCDIHRRDMKINYNHPFSNNRVSLENCIVTHEGYSMNFTIAQSLILCRLFRFWY
jgi:hypothetical protein